MGVYSGLKSYHYFNASTCAVCGSLFSACPWSASNNSVNTHQNENQFLAFRSLISNAEVENAMIYDFILYFTVKTNVYQNLIKLVFSLI